MTNRREGNLDKEVSVSGFSKEIQEFNEHFKVGEAFDTKDEDNYSSDEDEEEEEDAKNDEDESGNEGEIPCPEEDETTKEQDQTETTGLKKEELVRLQDEMETLCKELNIERNLENDESEELYKDTKKEEEVEETPSEVSERHSRRKKGKDADRDARLLFIKQLAKARELRQHCEENGEEAPPLEDMIDESMSDIHSVRSFSTTASTIEPEEIKRRLQKDLTRREKKQVSKKNLRVKGEANAYRRSKLANAATIKESVGWDEY